MRIIIFLICFFVFSDAQAQAEVSETLSYQTYEVRHSPGQSLLSAINAASPVRQDGRIFHGYTRWHVTWRFWWNEKSDRTCNITEVKTAVAGDITLPQLSTTDAAVMSQFNSYIEALRTHELGHYNFGVGAAREIERRISSLPSMKDCHLLESEANRIGYQILEEFKSKEKAYDQSTQYGKSQGAWLSR